MFCSPPPPGELEAAILVTDGAVLLHGMHDRQFRMEDSINGVVRLAHAGEYDIKQMTQDTEPRCARSAAHCRTISRQGQGSWHLRLGPLREGNGRRKHQHLPIYAAIVCSNPAVSRAKPTPCRMAVHCNRPN